MNLRNYFPSTQFALVFIAVAASATLIGFAAWDRGAKNEPLGTNTVQALPDTDGDGIKDWEELLRGTNPDLADTDGDGTKDGAEAAVGRDPLKPGPDDAFVAPAVNNPPDFSDVVTNSDNLTETVSQTLFASYVGLYGQGLVGDPLAQERAALAAAERVRLTPRGTIHTASELVVVSDKADNYRLFGNNVIRAIGRHETASFPYAGKALAQLVDYENPADLVQLDAVRDEYHALIEELLLVPVPAPLAPLYLEALNWLERTAGSFEDMRTLFTDPVRMLAGVRSYQLYLEETTRLFTRIAEELDKKGILFKESEAGFAWKRLRETAP